VTYPPGQGDQWPPTGPEQYPAGQGGGYPQQGNPQQQPGYPQQGSPQQQEGYPQTGPQEQQGYPQEQQGYPQEQQGYPQTGPQQAFPQTGPQPVYPQTGPQGYGYPAPQPGPRKRKGLVIGVAAAVVAVAVGATVTVVALNNSEEPVPVGAPSPTAAAMNLVSTLGKGDIAGLATTLVPAEANFVRDQLNDTVGELKRLEVLSGDAKPEDVGGVEITTKDLKFDDAGAERVNDHVTITKLVAGTITVNTDFSKIPLTKQFLEAAHLDVSDTAPKSQTVDIAKEIQEENHGEPVRIATVNVGGQWYPSVLYTVADYALQDQHKDWPKQGIAAQGAASPNDAVQQFAQAAVDRNVAQMIALLPPDELGALHDAGPVLVDQLGPARPTGVKITSLETDSSQVTGGTKVTLRKLTVQGPNGQTYSIVRQGDCFQMTGEGQSKQMCVADLTSQVGGENMNPEVRTALQHLVDGLLKNGIGVVTTQVDGKWYFSPFRSFGELELTALRSLSPSDVLALLRMGR
jgi:hypothetical protein